MNDVKYYVFKVVDIYIFLICITCLKNISTSYNL